MRAASGGGADVIKLDRSHAISCLVDLNWASAHISYRDSARGGSQSRFLIRVFVRAFSCFTPKLGPDWQSAWRNFYEEIILVKIDGSGVFRLAHHRSRSAEYYWAQSRAAISRDGGYVVFDSNMNINDSGLNSYSDVYMIKVRLRKISIERSDFPWRLLSLASIEGVRDDLCECSSKLSDFTQYCGPVARTCVTPPPETVHNFGKSGRDASQKQSC